MDVGNTAATIAVSVDGSIAARGRLLTVDNNAVNIRKALARLLGKRRAGAAVFCSVVPRVNKLWLRELRTIVGRNIVEVSHKVDLGLRIRYPKPQTIGADRLADACGAAWLYGAPVIVADFGTATTIDVVSRDGAYEGGVIAPGPMIVTDCLAERTALLPRIKAFQRCGGIGKSTLSAMTIGAVVGYRGLVREITEHLLRAMGERTVKLCATGGYAGDVLNGLDMPFIINPDLTLLGLWRIHELNIRAGCRASR